MLLEDHVKSIVSEGNEKEKEILHKSAGKNILHEVMQRTVQLMYVEWTKVGKSSAFVL